MKSSPVSPLRVLASLAALAAAPSAFMACAHEEKKTAKEPVPQDVQMPPSTSPPQFVVADPVAKAGANVIVPLGGAGVHGLVVDKRRVVVGPGEPRVAVDVAPEPIVGAARIPSRLGNGFLFWTSSSVYRADAFESALRPLARVPDAIDSISFMPKALLVRTRNGERWALNLSNGERAAILPLGAADVEALDDGRAISFNDQGAVFTSVDHGEHWTDATTQVKSAPNKVTNNSGELWLIESNGGASRLEADGHLAWFDKAPPETPPELRPKDPRWHGADTPLHAVFHAGAAIDESTAIVLDSGDLMHVDVRTGEILSVIPGRLPPDAQCEAVPIPGDVLFACVARNGNASSSGSSAFVVAHTLSSEPPTVEQTFGQSNGQFFASDDGGLVFGGPCQGLVQTPGNTGPTACVRLPGGRWEERDLTGLVTDGGAPGASDINVARWIPRSDGRVVALLAEPALGIYDPSSATFTSIADEARDVVGRGPISPPSGLRSGKIRTKKGFAHVGGIVDASWSFGGQGAIRGWQHHGDAVEISEDGKLTRSPFAFDVAFAGAMGLGRSKDGRLYQSSDHGATWSEVATPPTGVESNDLVSCTSAGCDLGAFYRVGWQFRPPRVEAPHTPAPAAPEVRRSRGLELACKPAGVVTAKVLPRSSESPEDLGLGMSRLSTSNEKTDFSFIRNVVPRGIVSPIHDPGNGSDDGTPALRGMLTGFGTSRDGDVITVTGPNKNAMALRRGVSFVAPFDPSSRVVRSGINMSDVVAAARKTGMTTDEILAEDFTETGVAVTLASLDPFAPSDIAIHNTDHGLLSVFRGERTRVAIRSSQNNASVVSGVSLPNDESAFLEVDSSGVGHVFKLTASGALSDLFDVSPTANETYYPANPDALAVDPKGNLAILRTPSGSDPPSKLDPAFLMIPATPPTALAPWSELKLADDAACKSEPGGYRAVLQVIAPWVKVSTPELRVADDTPMIARVRWTAKRVCLEGFEVRVPSVSVRVPNPSAGSGNSDTFSSWIVARGSSFARVSVAEGLEWRQPLECSILP